MGGWGASVPHGAICCLDVISIWSVMDSSSGGDGLGEREALRQGDPGLGPPIPCVPGESLPSGALFPPPVN